MAWEDLCPTSNVHQLFCGTDGHCEFSALSNIDKGQNVTNMAPFPISVPREGNEASTNSSTPKEPVLLLSKLRHIVLPLSKPRRTTKTPRKELTAV